jgi:tRNA modification GTPase
MEYREDTVAAMATPPGRGAIAIVRVSGNQAISIGDKIFAGKKKLSRQKGYTLSYGYIIDPENGEEVDQVVISLYRNPMSFTGEDMIEINCHGGVALPSKILDILIKQGCRLAGKGEFSKRAFLNGKIDLTQAEAINDIIHTSTLAGSRLALSNLKKKLSDHLNSMKNPLLRLLSKIEVLLDYPEEEIEEISPEDRVVLTDSLVRVRRLLEDGKRGRKIASGYRVALAGKTNVGKSSLLNALAGEEKAIVSRFHGTTRDLIEVELNLEGIPLILVDTAGIRDEYEHEIEGYGIVKTRETLRNSDLILFVLSAETGLTGEDEKILHTLEKEKTLCLVNKTDIGGEVNLKDIPETLYLSCKTGEGIPALIETLTEKLKIVSREETAFYLNQRQDEVLIQFLEALVRVNHAVEEGETLDIIAFELRRALNLLQEVLGGDLQEEVLESIFSNFCVGK